ncbi:uncharacterized protein AB9W97_001221 isoform 1-T1 [Spinachia spinachia]
MYSPTDLRESSATVTEGLTTTPDPTHSQAASVPEVQAQRYTLDWPEVVEALDNFLEPFCEFNFDCWSDEEVQAETNTPSCPDGVEALNNFMEPAGELNVEEIPSSVQSTDGRQMDGRWSVQRNVCNCLARTRLPSNSESAIGIEGLTTTPDRLHSEAASAQEVQAETDTQSRWSEAGCRTMVEKLLSCRKGDISWDRHKVIVDSISQRVLEKVQHVDVSRETWRHNIKRADKKAYKDLLKETGCETSLAKILTLQEPAWEETICSTLVKHMITPKKSCLLKRLPWAGGSSLVSRATLYRYTGAQRNGTGGNGAGGRSAREDDPAHGSPESDAQEDGGDPAGGGRGEPPVPGDVPGGDRGRCWISMYNKVVVWCDLVSWFNHKHQQVSFNKGLLRFCHPHSPGKTEVATCMF